MRERPGGLPTQSRQDLPLTYVDDAADILAAPYVILGRYRLRAVPDV